MGSGPAPEPSFPHTGMDSVQSRARLILSFFFSVRSVGPSLISWRAESREVPSSSAPWDLGGDP